MKAVTKRAKKAPVRIPRVPAIWVKGGPDGLVELLGEPAQVQRAAELRQRAISALMAGMNQDGLDSLERWLHKTSAQEWVDCWDGLLD